MQRKDKQIPYGALVCIKKRDNTYVFAFDDFTTLEFTERHVRQHWGQAHFRPLGEEELDTSPESRVGAVLFKVPGDRGVEVFMTGHMPGIVNESWKVFTHLVPNYEADPRIV